MLVGIPEELNDYDMFESNGITVYVKKDTKTFDGTLTITTETSLWYALLTVEGMVE